MKKPKLTKAGSNVRPLSSKCPLFFHDSVDNTVLRAVSQWSRVYRTLNVVNYSWRAVKFGGVAVEQND